MTLSKKEEETDEVKHVMAEGGGMTIMRKIAWEERVVTTKLLRSKSRNCLGVNVVTGSRNVQFTDSEND